MNLNPYNEKSKTKQLGMKVDERVKWLTADTGCRCGDHQDSQGILWGPQQVLFVSNYTSCFVPLGVKSRTLCIMESPNLIIRKAASSIPKENKIAIQREMSGGEDRE